MKARISKSLLCCVIISSALNATSLKDSVELIMNTNPDILSEQFNISATRLSIDEKTSQYYPTVDFETYYENSTTTDDPDNDKTKKNGWDAKVTLKQTLYDGGQTPNEIKQYKYRYNNVKYRGRDKIDDLTIDMVKTYNQLVSHQELMALDDLKLEIYKKYLKLAKNKELISGERLDSYQVDAKTRKTMDSYLERQINQEKTLSAYKKLTGGKLTGNICRPIIDTRQIPATVDDAIEIALRENNKIRSQSSLVKEQLSKTKVEASKFKPDLIFIAEYELNNKLLLGDDGQRNIQKFNLKSTWNLYNGGKDSITTQREKILVLKERKSLDSMKEEVIDNIKSSYTTYHKIKDRLVNLQKYIDNNKAIVKIYSQQLKDGSRTYLDMLNVEEDLFATKVQYIQAEFSLINEYFRILKSLNKLTDTILNSDKQFCPKYVFNDTYNMQTNNKDLEKELGLE